MINNKYPIGVDCVWLASDKNGNLAAFVTGGTGPIPIESIKCQSLLLEDIEECICDLPTVSMVSLIVKIKRPDDFVEMAKRGFFVYDWNDVHKTILESTQAYKAIAIPLSPITVDSLTDRLFGVAKVVKFNDLAFGDQLLDVRLHMKCCYPKEVAQNKSETC